MKLRLLTAAVAACTIVTPTFANDSSVKMALGKKSYEVRLGGTTYAVLPILAENAEFCHGRPATALAMENSDEKSIFFYCEGNDSARFDAFIVLKRSTMLLDGGESYRKDYEPQLQKVISGINGAPTYVDVKDGAGAPRGHNPRE